MLTGELKKELIEVLQILVGEHQETEEIGYGRCGHTLHDTTPTQCRVLLKLLE